MSLLLGLGLDLRFGGKVFAAPPANTVAPSISGIQTAGQTLAVSDGAWSQPVTSYAFQWKRNGTDIAGATAQTYVLQSGDADQAITCTVTATNAAGSASATSASVTPATALAISGAPESDAVVGAPWSFAPTASGGHAPYSFTATGVPSWATLDAGTGELSGTPGSGDVGTASGVVISAHDANGLTASLAPFDITVAPSAVALYEVLAEQREALSGNTPWTRAPVATSVDQGALVAIVSTNTSAVTQFSDSTGAVWTKAYERSDHGVVAVYKRMTADRPLVAGDTAFTMRTQFGVADAMIVVVSVPDATDVPTVLDMDAANQRVLPQSGGSTTQFCGVSAPGGVQVVGYRTLSYDNTCPAFGSDDTWQPIRKLRAANGSTLSVLYRKAGTNTDGTGLAYAPAGYTYNVMVWGEVAAPDTGPSGPPTPGGGGGGGLITNASQLVAVLGAGVAVNGGKTYQLDAGDFGAVNISGYDFSTNPVTFTGVEGTTFSSVSMNNCHGIVFENCKVVGYGQAGYGVYIYGGSTDLTFNKVTFNSGAVDGVQNGKTAIGVRNTRTRDANILVVGKGDSAAPDIWGYSTAVSVIQSNGFTVRDVVVANNGHDGIDFFGSLNCTAEGCLGYDLYSNVAAGDHPDWIQWAHYETDRAANIIIRNCGYERGKGQAAQGYFGDACDDVTVTGSWTYGAMYNSISASACTNITVTDNFLQSDAEYGSRIIIRGGSDGAEVSGNYAGSAYAYTEPATENSPAIPTTNMNIHDNTIIGSVVLGDYTDLDAWLATHPDARARLT